MRKHSLQGKAMTLVLASVFAVSGLPVAFVQAKKSPEKAVDEYQAVSQISDVDEYGADAASTSVVIIKDVMDWNTFATQCKNNSFKGVTVKLANDIAFDGVSNDNFTQAEEFKGTFDGCGHVMSGLITTSHGGLFNKLDEGIIKNVTITNSTFKTNKYYLGAFADTNYGTIDNCHVKNTTIDGTGLVQDYVGGIVGINSYKSVIKNCTVDTDSKVISSYYTGGICGDMYDGIINNCGNMAEVSGKYAGGIAAYANKVNNSYNVGKVTGTSEAGGIVYKSSGVLWNCYCSNESAELMFVSNSETGKYDHFALSEMQQQSFCDTLNKNRGTNADWLEWEKTVNSVYPTLKAVKSITACNIALAVDKVEYTGEDQTPVIAVNDGAYSLVLNTDYTVTYTNNKEIGTATVLIEGTGKYCDSVEKTFSIVKATPTYTYSSIGTKTYGDASANLNVKANKGDLGTITYTSSNSKAVTVNNNGYVYFNAPGAATITVKCSGTDYYESVSFTVPVKVLPSKPVIKLSSKKKKITIKYDKVVGASGYEIQYSLKKNLNSGVKTYKITKTKKVTPKLKKGKKYYVRVRAYTNAGGEVLNSAWSAKKSIKVKK